ncbi:unnamed protein product [Rotaria sp. Silwood2]|nr:unnamed protein product [Rotaria sp. Silwood2]CAF3918994.1 unnamed protein product [Rotaria sp. Silwood2]
MVHVNIVNFAFIYQGNQQSNCLTFDPSGSTSGQDAQNDSTLYDVCRSQQQSLRCPPNYIIDRITADNAAKSDENIGTGACVYDVNNCFQNDASTIQNICAETHQNRPSAYLYIDYKCIPNVVSGITTYNICNNNLYLIYKYTKPNQDIYLYIVDMDLNAPNLLGESGTKDRLNISADNNNMEM